ncbi:LysR family transcriptional regulator [Phyllobacterium chamaecytisi]|uniref:LysR family transcriptional regulator n=1 Tax=Phyllobacterium chamaecytisi TaxID=2876082 RepID=UPI001CCC853E|nr:LysR family transcriptional regulator [Phyllobacterium sp. KW56]MBZ9600783.1 LysR family transcriptional regulator [Phyllobacterium sp. KW56]
MWRAARGKRLQFRHTADRLYEHKNAASSIQLEDRLGVRLLLRSTHGLTPTEAGRSFYEHARRSIAAADEADMAARGAGANLSGRIRICAAVTFARLHVVPRLGAFLAEYPSLDVDIILDDRNTDLIEGGIDIALRMGQLTDSSLTARKLAQCKRLVLGAPSYLEAAGEPLIPADLAGHQTIVYDQRGGGAAWTFQQNGRQASVTVGGRVRVNAAEGIREAVLSGLGLAIASEWMFSPELESGRVRPVLQDWSLPLLDLWAVFPTGRQASAKARAFVDFIERQLVEAAPL